MLPRKVGGVDLLNSTTLCIFDLKFSSLKETRSADSCSGVIPSIHPDCLQKWSAFSLSLNLHCLVLA